MNSDLIVAENIDTSELVKRAEIKWEECPRKFAPGLQRYFEGGIPPGHFLQAVLSNDLREAYNRADSDSVFMLSYLLKFLEEFFPQIAWGSQARVINWERNRSRQHCDELENKSKQEMLDTNANS